MPSNPLFTIYLAHLLLLFIQLSFDVAYVRARHPTRHLPPRQRLVSTSTSDGVHIRPFVVIVFCSSIGFLLLERHFPLAGASVAFRVAGAVSCESSPPAPQRDQLRRPTACSWFVRSDQGQASLVLRFALSRGSLDVSL
jgi:hypothetical protein